MTLEVYSCCWLKRSTAVSVFCSASRASIKVASCSSVSGSINFSIISYLLLELIE